MTFTNTCWWTSIYSRQKDIYLPVFLLFSRDIQNSSSSMWIFYIMMNELKSSLSPNMIFFRRCMGVCSKPEQGCCNYAYPCQGNRTPRFSLPDCSQNWLGHSLLSSRKMPETMPGRWQWSPLPGQERVQAVRSGRISHPQIEHPESMGSLLYLAVTRRKMGATRPFVCMFVL